MGGFSRNNNGLDVVFAKNVDFSGGATVGDTISTNGQLLIGSTALNVGGTHINVGNITSPSGTINVGYSSPNITIDVNGSSVLETLTPDSGGAISPIAGNINVLGQLSITSPVMYTTQSPAGTMNIEDRSYITRYVVDPSSTAGVRGTYTTIQAAVNQAVADGATISNMKMIFIRTGLYNENVAIPNNATLVFVGESQRGAVTTGAWTFGTSCIVEYYHIDFLTAGAFYSLTLPTITAHFNDCNFDGLNVASGAVNTTGNGDAIRFYNCFFGNFAPLLLAGTHGIDGIKFFGCECSNKPITVSGGCQVYFENCDLKSIILADNGICNLFSCRVLDTTAASGCISGTSTLTQSVYSTTLIPGTVDAITATATFNCGGNICSSSTHKLYNTNPTIVYEQTQAGNITSVSLPAGNHTATLNDYFIGVDTSVARTINMIASPFKGLTYIVSDITGSAAANNITVNGNGSNIDGAASFTISSNYASITLVYTGTIWKVI